MSEVRGFRPCPYCGSKTVTFEHVGRSWRIGCSPCMVWLTDGSRHKLPVIWNLFVADAKISQLRQEVRAREGDIGRLQYEISKKGDNTDG